MFERGLERSIPSHHASYVSASPSSRGRGSPALEAAKPGGGGVRSKFAGGPLRFPSFPARPGHIDHSSADWCGSKRDKTQEFLGQRVRFEDVSHCFVPETTLASRRLARHRTDRIVGVLEGPGAFNSVASYRLCVRVVFFTWPGLARSGSC